MVSNAALRSREMTMVDLPESEERRILSKLKNGCFDGMVAAICDMHASNPTSHR